MSEKHSSGNLHPTQSSTAKERTGDKVGMLTAIRRDRRRHDGNGFYWLYRCECGGEKVSLPSSAKVTGHCGCLTKERLRKRHLTHGKSGTAIYKRWFAMIQRCKNESNRAYESYGGRGISVCERWANSLTAFIEDMGYPEKGETIERIDNDGDYEPSNCRWATRLEQQNNRRTNHNITINGETRTVSEWARKMGIRRETVFSRIRNGWNEEAAVLTPRLNQGRKDLGVTKSNNASR